MSGKVYILNTKMTSSVYIKMMQLLNFATATYTWERSNCILVEFWNLETIFYDRNIDTFLICGLEISKEYVISYIKNKFKIKKEDIVVINIPHFNAFNNIMQKHGFTSEKIKSLQNDAIKSNYTNNSYSDDYYTDLCYEFFYTFVKPFYPELNRPKVEILGEMNGFLHIKNSVYKTVSDKIFASKFYYNPQISDNKLKKFFNIGFGGLINYTKDIMFAPHKKYDLNESVNMHIFDRYINFLQKSRCVLGLYYDDEKNTCYVIKRASKNLKEDFSYKIDNHQYSYMNGIKVPNWLYNTPPDKLDFRKILSLTNIDVRTLAIKKLGLDKLIEYGEVKDSWENYPDNEWWAKSEYKLVDMHSFVPPIKIISGETGKVLSTKHVDYAPYLCMKNQTTGEYHLEGVSPNCRDLYDALKMRYSGLDLPCYEIKNIK